MSSEKILRFRLSMQRIELPGISAWSNGFALSKEISGDLDGTSEGLFINSGQAEGMRSYMVTEKISGTTAEGEEASVIVEHGGVESDDSAWFGRILPGTGTGAWQGISGTVKFDADAEGEMMVLSIT